MTAQYDFWKIPDNDPEKDAVEMTPRIVSQGVVKLKDVAKYIHASSTFQVGEVEAVLDALVKEVVRHLSDGKTVQLGQLGSFSLKLKSRKVTDKSKIHAQSVFVDTVKYRPSAWMKRQFISLPLQRAPEGFRSSAVSTLEQRRSLLEQYFLQHPLIDRKNYSKLTGRVKTSAINDLNFFVKEGYLIKYGSRSSWMYMKNPEYQPADIKGIASEK